MHGMWSSTVHVCYRTRPSRVMWRRVRVLVVHPSQHCGRARAGWNKCWLEQVLGVSARCVRHLYGDLPRHGYITPATSPNITEALLSSRAHSVSKTQVPPCFSSISYQSCHTNRVCLSLTHLTANQHRHPRKSHAQVASILLCAGPGVLPQPTDAATATAHSCFGHSASFIGCCPTLTHDHLTTPSL